MKKTRGGGIIELPIIHRICIGFFIWKRGLYDKI